jgi:membrane protease YdiL (CAAX protease family)
MRLPSALAEPRNSLRAIAVGWLLACPPSLLLAALVQQLLPQAEGPTFDVQGPAVVLMLVLFAPFVETLIMAAVLEVMLRLKIPPAAAIVLSAIGWGVAHSSAAPAWGLVIWWPFLIFSTLYVTWSKRSNWAAIGIVFAVHALQNLGPSLLLISERST